MFLSATIMRLASSSAFSTAAKICGFSCRNLLVVEIMVNVVEPPMTSSEVRMV